MSNEISLVNKWKNVIEHKNYAPLLGLENKKNLAQILENTVASIHNSNSNFLTEEPVPVNAMGDSSSTASTGAIDTYDPILISLVRRAVPNLISNEICGTQPMKGPTGVIFAMRSRYSDQSGPEAFYNEANTEHSSVVDGSNNLGQKMIGSIPTGNLASYNTAGGMLRDKAERLGTNSGNPFNEMSFSIEKISVTANTRALATGYTQEIAQDLRAIHGLDAESELVNILSGEIIYDINREIIRTVNIAAVPGAQTGTTQAGIFDLDTDSNGRWLVEKFKGLLFSLDLEANAIAKATRRGKGNIIICSSNVAAALAQAGRLDYAPVLNTDALTVDDTGNTFAGILDRKYKVFIDPYTTGDYYTIGYRGPSNMDAGIFYAPYTPLQLAKAVDPRSFNMRLGFKTRYGIVANPFAEGLTQGNGVINPNRNVYYRRVSVANIM